MSELPEGLSTRPANPADLDAVLELISAEERSLHDVVDVDREDIASDWARPSFDIERDTLSVWEGDTLVGHGEIYKGRRADVTVRPGEEGRGIGTFLRAWTEWRALDATPSGRVLVGQTVSDHHRVAAAGFEADGYAPMWTSWILQIDLDDDIPATKLPEGLAIRTFELGVDERETYELIETAFSEWPDREPQGFEDWAAHSIERSDFDPELTYLVLDAEEIVGVAYTIHYENDQGWVQQFAVKQSHRGRGLARAMLQTAFAEFRRRGERTVGVNTDSRTGALSLYEHVGMHVHRSYTHWAKELRTGNG